MITIRGALLTLICMFAFAPSSRAQDDLAAAEKLALNHCGVCHAFESGAAPRQGPTLHGVVGRNAGSDAGFKYSDGFKKALGGKTWSAELIDKWITDPQAVAPGSVMLYKQADEAKRALLIKYLESLK